MERVHNINLHPLKNVQQWNTKRVKTYMFRIQKHISYLENYKDYEDNNDPTETKNAIKKFKSYKIQLKKILANRENVD